MVRHGAYDICLRGFSGIEESSASFRTQPDIIADVDSYEPQELLTELFNLVAGYVSIGSGWQFESVQSLAINLCPYRPTIGTGSFIEISPFFRSKGVLNIKNEDDDYCLLWSVLAQIHRVEQNKNLLYHYKKYFNELNITDLQFPLKHTDVPKFETKLTLRSASTSSCLKIKRSSRSMRPSIEIDHITSMCS